MDGVKITISKVEYDELRSNTTALFIIERAVRNDTETSFGYSSSTRAIVEAVLGIERKEKAD